MKHRSPAVSIFVVLAALLWLGGCGGGSDRDEPPVVELKPDSRAAARFLTQATFGPTEADIASLVQSGYPAWIDAQMNLPVSETLPYVKANSNGSLTSPRHDIWWSNAIRGEDQLRQRMAFALSQIFVVSDIDYILANNQYAIASYYDMLARQAFGNYRELLSAVTLHPAMGIYLSMLGNEKANPELNIRPDENFAREVLQLFSIGLYELDAAGQALPADNPVPAYTQQTVEAFARVFTGWTFPGAQSWQSAMAGHALETPMIAFEEYHDNGAKTLLQGQQLPAGLSAREDLDAALDNIFMHPNVGPFFSKLLIQRLITSNPTAAYVRRVAAVFNNNGNGVRGDLAAVLRAILLDPEARNGHLSLPGFGKLKEPLIRMIQYFRALEAVPGETAEGKFRSVSYSADRIDELLGQAVMRSTSVFNFYQPDNAVSSNALAANGRALVSPEQQILTESSVASTNNDTHSAVYLHHNQSGLSASPSRISIDRLLLLSQSPEELLDTLDLLLLAGQMSAPFRQNLLDHIHTLGGGQPGNAEDSGDLPQAQPGDQSAEPDVETARAQVLDTLYLILASPEYMVQR